MAKSKTRQPEKKHQTAIAAVTMDPTRRILGLTTSTPIDLVVGSTWKVAESRTSPSGCPSFGLVKVDK